MKKIDYELYIYKSLGSITVLLLYLTYLDITPENPPPDLQNIFELHIIKKSSSG